MAPKQQRLPGQESAHHKDITKAAEKYVEVRDQRMDLTRQETEQRDNLLTAMRKHKLSMYEDDNAGLEVQVIEPAAKVKVRRIDEDGDE